jgi:hypothetical protein
MSKLEEAIKKIISDNWVRSWGNHMGSWSRDELERQCLDFVKHVEPNVPSIVLAALISLHQYNNTGEG